MGSGGIGWSARRALEGTVRAIFSLPGARSRWDGPLAVTLALIAGATAVRFARSADSTLRWLRYEDFREHPERELAAIVEFEPQGDRQLLPVSPASMRHYLEAGMLMRREAWQAAFAELARAESTQTERGAHGFLGRIAGKRAFCWLGLARPVEGEREARRGLALWPDGGDARYTLASVMAFTGRRSEAQEQLDTLLRFYPNDRSAQALQDSLRSWAASGR